jgi:periplasmic protein TonB
MTGYAANTRVELTRWLVCGAVVVLAHVGGAAALVRWTDPVEWSEPSAAIVVMLAPLPVASAQPPEEIAPGPDQVQAEATPEKAVEVLKDDQPVQERPPEPVAEMQAEATRAETTEFVVAALPPEATPEPKPQDNNPPAPITSAPQAIPVALAPEAAAPVQGTLRVSDSTSIPKWQTQIAATLERNKRYPPEARARGHQGVVRIAFSLDRSGHLVTSRIVHGSGHVALDEETLRLLQRAQPFPRPPVELPGEHIDLIVPVRFDLR